MFSAAEEMLTREVARGGCSGFGLAVGQGERVLWQSVGGTLGGASGAAATAQTRYDMSSLTEVMVAAPLTLLALEKGWLCLSDPLSAFVSAPADKRDVTLWHLLTHTSGMKSNFLLEDAAENPEDALRAALHYPLSAMTGKRTKRSTIGLIVLGKVLEQVYGLPLDQAAKRHLFAPLGMKGTGYLPTGDDVVHIGVDALTGEPRKGLPHDENARFLHGVAAHAGLFSNLEDCCRFLAMLAGRGRLGAELFLTPASVALMLSPQARSARDGGFLGELWPEAGYGYASAMGASIAVDPDSGLFVALLMNRDPSLREETELARLRRRLHNAVFAEFVRLPAEG